VESRKVMERMEKVEKIKMKKKKVEIKMMMNKDSLRRRGQEEKI